MLVGIHDERRPAQLQDLFPGTMAARIFPGSPSDYRNIVANLVRKCEPYWALGMTVFVSFKPRLADVRGGKWDAPIRNLMRELHERGVQFSTVLIPWHEPENDMTGLEFSEIFNRVRDIGKNASPHVLWCYSAMAYQWMPKGTGSIRGNTDRPRDWGMAQADIYGCDVYSGGSSPLTHILPEHTGFRRWLAELAPEDKLKAVTERGFQCADTDHARRAATITREADWLTEAAGPLRITSYIYWNTSGTENNPRLVLDDGGEQALRYLVSRMTGPPPTTIQCPTCQGSGRVPA